MNAKARPLRRLPSIEVFARSLLGGMEHRWRLRGRNGEIVAQSEGYTRRESALRAAKRLPKIVAEAVIVSK